MARPACRNSPAMRRCCSTSLKKARKVATRTSRSASRTSASFRAFRDGAARPARIEAPMSDVLSVFAAAREAPRATALRLGDRAYRFDELADLVSDRMRSLPEAASPPRPFALVGTNTLDTALTVYALLQKCVPLLLLHPRATPEEQSAEVEA